MVVIYSVMCLPTNRFTFVFDGDAMIDATVLYSFKVLDIHLLLQPNGDMRKATCPVCMCVGQYMTDL